MKIVKIQIDELVIKSDPTDEDILKEDIATKIMDLIERDELEYTIVDEEELDSEE